MIPTCLPPVNGQPAGEAPSSPVLGPTGDHKLTIGRNAMLEKWVNQNSGSLNLDGRKKQSTRMLRCRCMDCGYTLRTTQKWIEVGVPTCCWARRLRPAPRWPRPN